MRKTFRGFFKAVQTTNQSLESYGYLCDARLHPTYFTRGGKMGFVNLVVFILNLTKKSLQIELDNFFRVIQGTGQSITKQSFSEARQKLSPKAFVILFRAVIKQYYAEEEFKTYRGYRLSAIDGSTLELQNSEALRAAFGYAENKSHQIARARVSGLLDLENNLLIDATIGRYDVDEQTFALEHIERLKEYGLKKDLILFDRGYPSKELIARLVKANIDYLMRVSSQFIKEVNLVKTPDAIVEFQYKRETYRLRVVKFRLESGVEEILITSLLDPSFTIDDLKELYFKRWGIEGKYKELKHKLEVENFTGEKPIIVEQDFYASMYLSNMAALAKMATDELINEKNQGKDLKYEQQTNTNILIGKLKDRLILIILEPCKRKRTRMLYQLMEELSHYAIPIRPGRFWPRIKKTTRDRYPMNQKKCL